MKGADGKFLIGGFVYRNILLSGSNFPAEQKGFAMIRVIPSFLGIGDSLITDSTIYPNPFSDFINIKTSNSVQNIEVIDMNGRLLEIPKFASENGIAKLNLSNLNQGIYFLKMMTSDNKITLKKIIKK
ncbi:T9SS type A sorting domain-containing protein [Flavobacterium sp. 3HN19-14]|uniref:T9SS type A sorting domain-containing protein n=1 Tax=Flavobacterium sp. 3HN19-14 TaxID=3448133 RepID=UPI003EE009F2